MNTEEFIKLMTTEVKMYDLTQPLSVHTPPWPSYMPLGIQYFKRIAGADRGQGANGQIITSSNHVGTHMDGEIHFYGAGRAIGAVPLEEWVGPGVVVDISDEVGVMYLGNLVEYSTKKEIFLNPLHPYTQALLSAVPIPDPTIKMNRIILEGSIPSPATRLQAVNSIRAAECAWKFARMKSPNSER